LYIGNDQEVVANLPRGNYTLTVEATSIDNNSQKAFEVFGPVFLFGSNIVEGQSAAGVYMCMHLHVCTNPCVTFTFFTVMCSGSVHFFSMDFNYMASWRARENRIEAMLVANISQQWLSIGFTDKNMMVSLVFLILIQAVMLYSLEI